VLLLRFMFGERRYHKCEARVYAFNEDRWHSIADSASSRKAASEIMHSSLVNTTICS
jgi:hypothetical protein